MGTRNSTKWIILGLVVVLALALAGWWWVRADEARGSDAKGDQAAKVDVEEALRLKQAARTEHARIERVAIGGRVLRADDDSPIVGAIVLVSRKGIIQGQAPNAGEPSQPLMAVTDQGGEWKLAGVDPGGYMLSATAEGFLPGARTDLRVTGREDQHNFNLALEIGGSPLSGTITDIGGGPIEGVLVRVSDVSSLNLGFDNAALATISDEEGRYQMQLANGRYAVSTHHFDYVADARLTELTDGGRVEDFELIPGGTIEGVVLARPEGDPVAGARVTFSDSRNQGMGGATTNISVDGSVLITDEQGRFRLPGLRAGVVSLSARSSAHASLAPEEVAIGIGEQVTDVELWVDTAHTISGYVVPKGAPDQAIEGVLVGAWQMQPFGLLVANSPTASDGFFEIVGVPPGTWQVGAVGEDNLMALTGATANVKDADVSDLFIELDVGIYVRGRVDPGMTARVRVQPDPESASLANIGGFIADAIATGTANEDGEFEIGPLSPGGGMSGRMVTLVAENDQGFKGELELKLGREDMGGVVLSMTKGASVSGTVLDSNGMPQAGVVVSVSPAEPDTANMGMMFGGPGGDGSPTGEDGHFAVRGLDTGAHLVLVKDSKGRAMSWEEGSGPVDKDGKPEAIEIEIEDTVNEQFLDLRVVPRDGVISGVVLDAEGLPVMDAWVRASLDIERSELFRQSRRNKDKNKEQVEGVVPEDDSDRGPDFTRSTYYSEQPVLTDENGLFVIKELRGDRNYHLVAEGERGGARATQSSVAPGSRVSLTLEQLSGIDGVVSLDGVPVSEYSVELRGPSRADKRVNHPEGKFQIDRLDPGDYEIYVHAKTGTGEAELTLAEAGREQVEVELVRGGTVRGRVIGDTDGEPIAGLMVMVRAEGRSGGEGVANMLTGQGPKTGRDGRFEVSDVAAGKGTINFLDREAQLSGAAEVAEVDFEVEPGGEVDLGDIQGMQGDTVPRDERGTLQMNMRAASWAARPRPPGTDLDQEQPDPDDSGADESKRLWVMSIEVGGVAEDAGIVPGDEVITLDGQSVATMGVPMARAHLSSARLRIGQEVRLELRRGDDRIDVGLKAVAKDKKVEAGAEASPEP